MLKIPVIDIFAGPGGLNEGFSSYASESCRFDVKLSVEKDANACETLRMRVLFRYYKEQGHVPELYYEAIRGDVFALQRLKTTKAWATADEHVKQWTLGEIEPAILHRAIAERVGDSREWVLLGGPPCQVYSIIGRASMKGPGLHHADDKTRDKQRRALEDAFAADHRHTLYRQYLQIVAIHEPAVFVMENVKGILSAALPLGRKRGGGWRYEPVFQRILADLRDPRAALSRDRSAAALLGKKKKKGAKYKLFSFVTSSANTGECDDPNDFIIECEKFGTPQTRHRVIILGVRENIDISALRPISEAKRPVTVRQTLASLPKLRSRISKDSATSEKFGEDSWSSWRRAVASSIPAEALREAEPAVRVRIKQVLKNEIAHTSAGSPFEVVKNVSSDGLPSALRKFLLDPRLKGFIQHESRSHMASDLGRYLYASVVAELSGASPNIEQWPLALLPAHRNVKREHRKAIVDAFKDRFRVQVWDRPSTTVTSHAAKDGHYNIHPDPSQCRSLTVRELARLQTFPDNYWFMGGRTDQYQQVGNAVPPFVAIQLAEVVSRLFESKRAGN